MFVDKVEQARKQLQVVMKTDSSDQTRLNTHQENIIRLSTAKGPVKAQNLNKSVKISRENTPNKVIKQNAFQTPQRTRKTSSPSVIITTRAASPNPLMRKTLRLDSSLISNTFDYRSFHSPAKLSPGDSFEKYSPKAKFYNDEAVVHHISVTELKEIYNLKCIDAKVDPHENQMKHFLEKFDKFCKKRNFHIEDQQVGPLAAIRIADILSQDDHFLKLNLSRNTIGDEGAKHIAYALQSNHSLIHVDLSSNSIGPEGISALISSLIGNDRIISLNVRSHEGLSRNRVDTKSVEKMEKVLKENKVLEYFNIAGTGLNLHGMLYITKGLYMNESLISLDLSNNDLGPTAGIHLCKGVAFSNLQELYLGNTGLGDVGVSNLFNIFLPAGGRINGTLEIIDVSNNDISYIGAVKIFESLHLNRSLFKLILDGNNLSGTGIFPMVSFLTENRGVQYLSLSDCKLGFDGSEILANGLNRNSTVETLILSKNPLKSHGIKVLAEVLAEHKSIKHLDFSSCRIHNDGGIYIANMIKNNKIIKRVELKDNTFFDEAGIALIDAAKAARNVSKVSLDRNPVSHKYCSEIYKVISNNREEIHRKDQVKFVQTMENLRKFEINKFKIDIERKELEIKKEVIAQEYEEVLKEYEKVKQEEQAKYDEIEAVYQEVRKAINDVDAQTDFMENEIRNLTIDLNSNSELLTNGHKKFIIEIASIQQKIEAVELEVKPIRQRYQPEVDYYQKLLNEELARVNQQQANCDIIVEQINKVKEEKKKNLKKALMDLENIDDRVPTDQSEKTRNRNATSRTSVSGNLSAQRRATVRPPVKK